MTAMGARAVPFLHDGAGNVLCELDRRGTVWCRPALTRVLSDQEDNSVQSVVDLLRSIYSSDASDDRVANLQVAVARQIVRRCTGWDLNDEEPTLAPSSSSSSEQEDEEDHDDDDDPSIVLAEPLRRRPLPEPVAEPVDDDPEEIDGDAGGEDDASVGVSSDPAASQGPVPVSAPTCAYAVSRPLPPARRRSSMLYPDAKASVVAPPTGSRPAVSVWTPDTFPRRLSSGVRQEFSSFTLEAHGKKLSSSRVRCLERIQASIDGENAALVAIDLVALVACNAMLREMLDDAQTTLPDLPLPTRKSFGDSPRKRSSGGDRRSNGESPRSDRILLFRVLKVNRVHKDTERVIHARKTSLLINKPGGAHGQGEERVLEIPSQDYLDCTVVPGNRPAQQNCVAFKFLLDGVKKIHMYKFESRDECEQFAALIRGID